jgi:phosphatidylglycerol:prolipoprotein diacylglycerol transferase
MIGPYEHRIDPVIFDVAGFAFWWYGLSYTLGFIGVFLWLRRNRARLDFGMNEVYNLTLFICAGVLLGGRLVEVFFYEWAWYSRHPLAIGAVWLGGMSTHGILLGAILSILLFCRMNRRSFFEVADVLAIAAAYIMGVGRIGNFIDGQIVGSLTDGWWGVKFPDAEGYRHPVVLYDGIKNLLIIPLLIWIRSLRPPRGALTAHFILWYGFLRIFVDFFREYRTELMGFPPGQEFNILMTVLGLGMLFFFKWKGRQPAQAVPASREPAPNAAVNRVWLKRGALCLLLVVPAVIPSDWTQDVPERYGARHPGLQHSALYPPIP